MKNTVDKVPTGAQLRTIGPWTANIHPTVITMTSHEKRTLIQKADEWKQVFPKEVSTLAWKALNTPSVLIRFDYVMHGETMRVYEVEERPAGLAIATAINGDFSKKLSSCFGSLKNALKSDISVLVADSRIDSSDDLVLTETGLHPFGIITTEASRIPLGHAMIVRSFRDEEPYWRYEGRSLSTIREEGYKGYGVPMQLWKKISGMPSFDEPFVVKPLYGSRCENLLLYSPNGSGNGFSTRTKILNAIEQKLVAYIQPYHSPECPDFLSPEQNMIRRVYCGFNPSTDSFECLGGLWMSRKCVKVHGASDSLTGVIHA